MLDCTVRNPLLSRKYSEKFKIVRKQQEASDPNHYAISYFFVYIAIPARKFSRVQLHLLPTLSHMRWNTIMGYFLADVFHILGPCSSTLAILRRVDLKFTEFNFYNSPASTGS